MANLNALLERVKKLEANRKITLFSFRMPDGTMKSMSAKRTETAIQDGIYGRSTGDSLTLLHAESSTACNVAWRLVRAMNPSGCFPWEPVDCNCDLLATSHPMRPRLTVQ